MSRSRTRSAPGRHSNRWTLMVLLGIAWMVAAWTAPRFTPADADAASWLAGTVLMFAAGAELAHLAMVPQRRSLHLALGALSTAVGAIALGNPSGTMIGVAALVGYFLLLRGALDMA